jgi:hypothetical protein
MDAPALQAQQRAARVRLVAQLTAVLGSRRTSATAAVLLAAGGGAYLFYMQGARHAHPRPPKPPDRCAPMGLRGLWGQCENTQRPDKGGRHTHSRYVR